jgi:hypothetical protein
MSQGYSITLGILPLPKLPNRLRDFIQPLTVRQQRDEFNGAEKLHRIRIWPAQWLQFPRSDEQCDIFRRAVQQLRHLSSEQPGWQIFCRPGRHRHLCYVVRHRSIAFGHRFPTSYPACPTAAPALRAGAAVGLAGSHQSIQHRNRSVFYPLLVPPIGRSCVLPRRCLIF